MSAVLHALTWALLVLRPAGLPLSLVEGLIFWGGLTNGGWIPAYAQLKDSLPPAVAGTAVGFLNFAFFSGAAVFQQATGALQATGAGTSTYQTMFALFLGAMLVAVGALWLSVDARPVESPAPSARRSGRSDG